MNTPQKLFEEDGHLTIYALEALVRDEPLDELSRLEISEHLAFCDQCVDRYTAMLTEGVLLPPEEPMASSVIKRLRQKARRAFRSRYTSAVAAACLTLIFWNLGIFQVEPSQNGKFAEYLYQSVDSFHEKTTAFTDRVTQGLDQILNQFTFERSLKK